jgi:hypothetical protein
LEKIPVSIPSPIRHGAPLDCFRNRPEILAAIGDGISRAGYMGIKVADSKYAPSAGTGSVTYVNLNICVGEALFHFDVERLEANGINHLVLPETKEFSEVRLVFSRGQVLGPLAYLHEKGPCSLELIDHNCKHLGINNSSQPELRLLDSGTPEPDQLELPYTPSYLSVWVIWNRYPDRMEAWIVIPVSADRDKKRIGCYDVEALGSFEHSESPQSIIDKANQPQSTPTPFTIEERPDGTNGTSG